MKKLLTGVGRKRVLTLPTSAMPLGCSKCHSDLPLSWELSGISLWYSLHFLPSPLPRAATLLHLPLSPQIKFEFIPRHLDITESFWVFTIPEKSMSVLFLLVGHSTEPLVTLDRSHLNLHLLLVGEHVVMPYTLRHVLIQFCCSSQTPKRKLEMGAGTCEQVSQLLDLIVGGRGRGREEDMGVEGTVCG